MPNSRNTWLTAAEYCGGSDSPARLVTDTTVSKELWLCHTQVGLRLDEIQRIVLNGFKGAFLPFHVKQAWLRRISKELETFEIAPGQPAGLAPSAHSERPPPPDPS